MKNLKLNRLAMQGALIAMLLGAVVLGGCGDESPAAPEQALNNEEQNTPPEQNEPQETVPEEGGGFCEICHSTIGPDKASINCQCGQVFHENCMDMMGECPLCGWDPDEM